ncbi:MAG: 30S ribosomal protein S20 [Thermodesulfobacteriota bacterium]|nr:30S ribosomal protein S20 [Thermodesulfobacteriota bacterium]
MANHKSAIKRYRQSLKASARNRAMRTRIKNVVKAVRKAVVEKDAAKAEAALKQASSVLDKAGGKSVIHRRTAARKISRLNLAVNRMGQA